MFEGINLIVHVYDAYAFEANHVNLLSLLFKLNCIYYLIIIEVYIKHSIRTSVSILKIRGLNFIEEIEKNEGIAFDENELCLAISAYTLSPQLTDLQIRAASIPV